MSTWINYLYTGDSITEGYKDNVGGSALPVTTGGIPGRQLHSVVLGQLPNENHINLGQSGFLVREYLARAYGYISADPTAVTVAVTSVYTPNVVPGESFNYSWRADTLADNLAALIEFETFCLAHSVIFMPVFWCASPLGLDAGGILTLQSYVDTLSTRWPWLIKAYLAIQDVSVTTGPYTPTYFAADATHPYANNGYDLLRGYFNTDKTSAVAAAKTYYGFST